jgi:pilus assembly protein Flp/PilA
MTLVGKFWIDRKGATLIEYALIAGLLSIAAVIVLGTIGSQLRTMYSGITTQVSNAAAGIS